MRRPQQDQCVVCGKVYPLPEPGEFGQGKHMWTCSDRCQQEFLVRGGIRAFMDEPVAGRQPSSRQ